MDTIRKLKLFINHDKEEVYINEMCVQGYALTKVRGFSTAMAILLFGILPIGVYEFERCVPGEYVYKLDIRSDKTESEATKYEEILRDSGIEIIAKGKERYYLRKKGSFDIYTDKESKINFYKKLIDMYLTLIIFFLITFVVYVIKSVQADTLSMGNLIHSNLLRFALMSYFGILLCKCRRTMKEIERL